MQKDDFMLPTCPFYEAVKNTMPVSTATCQQAASEGCDQHGTIMTRRGPAYEKQRKKSRSRAEGGKQGRNTREASDWSVVVVVAVVVDLRDPIGPEAWPWSNVGTGILL